MIDRSNPGLLKWLIITPVTRILCSSLPFRSSCIWYFAIFFHKLLFLSLIFVKLFYFQVYRRIILSIPNLEVRSSRSFQWVILLVMRQFIDDNAASILRAFVFSASILPRTWFLLLQKNMNSLLVLAGHFF